MLCSTCGKGTSVHSFFSQLTSHLFYGQQLSVVCGIP